MIIWPIYSDVTFKIIFQEMMEKSIDSLLSIVILCFFFFFGTKFLHGALSVLELTL